MSPGPLVLLVALDGSPHAQRALAHALRLCAEARCELHLCNVQPAYSPAEMLLETREDVVEHWSAASGHAVLDAARAAVADAGHGAREAILNGDPAEEITRHAREIGADLVLMGTRGLSPAKELLLGSVAQKTLAAAPCAVVTAHAFTEP